MNEPQTPYTISPLGDAALLISLGNCIDEDINKKVLRLFHRLHSTQIVGVVDITPAYSSLAVYYDVMAVRQTGKTAFEVMKEKIFGLLTDESNGEDVAARIIEIPVCYDKDLAPDIEILAAQKTLTVEEVIHLHATTTYRVYTLGFLPGFAYMGKVAEKIATPRKASPVNVATGSVGIAGEQTGIYPYPSPGGWNIIGRTPVPLFDKEKMPPALLQPGDEVTFYPITKDEFENYKGRLA